MSDEESTCDVLDVVSLVDASTGADETGRGSQGVSEGAVGMDAEFLFFFFFFFLGVEGSEGVEIFSLGGSTTDSTTSFVLGIEGGGGRAKADAFFFVGLSNGSNLAFFLIAPSLLSSSSSTSIFFASNSSCSRDLFLPTSCPFSRAVSRGSEVLESDTDAPTPSLSKAN